MRRYVHWFDSEYFRTAHMSGVHRATQIINARRMIKTFALLGIPLVLNDMQIIESPPVLEIFNDDVFRSRFLDVDPTFVQLVANSAGALPGRGAFSIATSGLRRCLREGWISSTYDAIDVELLKYLAEQVTTLGEVDLERIMADKACGTLGTRIEESASRIMLWGLLKAASYFADHEAATLPQLPGKNMLTILEEALQRAKVIAQDPEDIKHLEFTKDYIVQNVDVCDRDRRSIVITALEKSQKYSQISSAESTLIRSTVVHAWNEAVQHNVAPEGGGSIRYLPGAVMVSLYLDRRTEVIWSSRSQARKMPLIREGITSALLSGDPVDLTWMQIANAVHATWDTRCEYQQALRRRDSESIQQARKAHMENLARYITPRPWPTGEFWHWGVPTLVADVVLAASGHIALAGDVSIASLGMREAYDFARRATHWGRKWVVINTLTGLADQAEQDLRLGPR